MGQSKGRTVWRKVCLPTLVAKGSSPQGSWNPEGGGGGTRGDKVHVCVDIE